jgi:predicted TIM-barrel fold metal-dependent hydrolase
MRWPPRLPDAELRVYHLIEASELELTPPFPTNFIDNPLQSLAVRSVDVHQHLWPEGVLRVLERRSAAPKATWRHARWHVDLPGEPGFHIDPADHDPHDRAARLPVDKALVALSSPVGLEALPARDALAAVAAWQEAAKQLPPELGWWSATPAVLTGDGEAEIAKEAIADGAAGVCLPANRLATPDDALTALPLLAAVAEAGAPVFVHPGPATGRPSEPPWWSPATRYVAQQHAAWHSFHHAVRPELPTLRAIFALLAGLAPLHAERTDGRSRTQTGEAALADPLTFYDTSSYGPRAVRAMATAVGITQLVHGTDHPVARQDQRDPVEEAFGEGFAQLVRTAAPRRALGYTWVPAARGLSA